MLREKAKSKMLYETTKKLYGHNKQHGCNYLLWAHICVALVSCCALIQMVLLVRSAEAKLAGVKLELSNFQSQLSSETTEEPRLVDNFEHSKPNLIRLRRRKREQHSQHFEELLESIIALRKRSFKKIRKLRKVLKLNVLKLDEVLKKVNTSAAFGTISSFHFVLTTANKSTHPTVGSVGPWTATGASPPVKAVNSKSFLVTGSAQEKLHVLHVLEEGLYYVYAQITFNNLSPHNVFELRTWPRDFSSSPQSVAQCVQTSAQITRSHSFSHCSVAVALKLLADTYVEVRSAYRGRTILAFPSSTFIGLLKLA